MFRSSNPGSCDNHVAVVGGGMAGLSPAAALSQAGYDVVLLEASDYFGGRVKQVTPFKGFAPIDLGGEFIHGSDSIINRLAKENGWPVKPCHQCEGEKSGDMFYYKGSLYPLLGDHPDIKKAWEAWDEIITLWDKTAKVAGTMVQEKAESLMKTQAMENRENCALRQQVTPQADLTILEWLRQNQYNEDVIAILDAAYCQTAGARLSQMGVWESSREENAWEYGSGNFRLRDSYSKLVGHFIDKCSRVVKHLCWQVREIDWRGANLEPSDGKQDQTNFGGRILLKNQHGHVLSARRVIITVPLTVLKDGDINFIPALPESKRKAIDKIQMTGALKIVCRFKFKFWPEHLNLVYNVRGFISQIWMYTRDSLCGDDKCHLVAGFQTAQLAEEKISLSEKEVLDGFLQELDEIFSTDSDLHPATDSLMDFVYYHWSKHPFIRGGYSSPTAHAWGMRHALATPVEDHLFFAGEATSLVACATVHTAIETGLRAAREVSNCIQRVDSEMLS
ncbi:PREDICTED: polyamine oxidase 3-like [Acropora digitifera]|uniref:polyamine oxidase 3-like n=1 Tax=Acropora digitifera TaxID=70779 RepID=UPI00077A05C1|nr:PREDICTED: polyamine oxidase 3-like [Acropora digitifera]